MIRTTYPGGTKQLHQPIIFIYEQGHARHALLHPHQQQANQTITNVTIEYERHGEVSSSQVVNGPTPVIASAALKAVQFAEAEALHWKTKILRIFLPTVQFLDEQDMAGLVSNRYPVIR
ncbi:hypothetical protein AB4Y42_14115 [Paraburkholderia sp. EG286B]|uniref:hypothetical protein n=1 Tax=Paraburkholderia sp. EG286B TaxID=3237011 RepID=UPI0034D1A4BE